MIFFVEKMREALQCKSFSDFSTKNIGIFEILTFEDFNDTLTNDVVSSEQPGR